MKLKIIIIMMILLCASSYAAEINKTFYYNVSGNYSMRVYDKINFSVKLDLVNNSAEYSFNAPFNYSITNITTTANVSAVQIAVACGDATLVCPTITIPACPTDPPIPACPVAPSCPSQPAPDNSALNNCLASIDKKLNPQTTDQDRWVTYGILAAIVVVVGLLIFKQFSKNKPPQIPKQTYEPIPIRMVPKKPLPLKNIPIRPEQKYKPQITPEDPRKTIARANLDNAKKLLQEMEEDQQGMPEPLQEDSEEDINQQLKEYIESRR